MNRICPNCGDAVPSSKAARAKFCSRACKASFASKKFRAKTKSERPAKFGRDIMARLEPTAPAKSNRAIMSQLEPTAAKTHADSTDHVARILSPNFYLPDLAAELETLRTPAARREIEKRLREAMAAAPRWPTEPCGRAALVLRLLDNPKSLEGVRFRHAFEKVFDGSTRQKPSILQMRRGGGGF
jgi:hypothetical protein